MLNSRVLLALIAIGAVCCGLANGDDDKPCTIRATGAAGICRPIGDCKPVFVLFQRQRNYTICEFGDDGVQVVCCPLPRRTNVGPKAGEDQWVPRRMYERKCDEYKSAVYEKVYVGAFLHDSETKELPVANCSSIGIPFIVSGQNAKPKEFPHMALLGYKLKKGFKWTCGGSLISERFVLTAAHCTYVSDFGDVSLVRLGELVISSSKDDADEQDFGVERIILPDGFNFRKKTNDIALLKLDGEVKFSTYIRPICLPSADNIPDKKYMASGWGHTELAGTPADHMQVVVIENFPMDECKELYAYQPISERSQMCAGSRNDSRDTCQGDSGGPLQIHHKALFCMFSLVGVTSFGQACGVSGVPGVYTRVFPFVDWIERQVWGAEKAADDRHIFT